MYNPPKKQKNLSPEFQKRIKQLPIIAGHILLEKKVIFPMVLMLASDKTSYVTGQTISVSGGYAM